VSERIVPLDVLRGVALLGILLMNVRFFAAIGAAYENPTAYGDLHGANYGVWYLTALLADSKFMAIFSMLFGAGVVLMAGRREKAGKRPLFLHLRRMAVLLLLGLAHAYLLWAGDILYTYALCGTVVYFFRRCRPAVLLVLGTLVLAIGSAVPLLWYEHMPQADREALRRDFQPPLRDVEAELRAYRGDWWRQNEARWPAAWEMQTKEFAAVLAWRAGGLMLIGMALFKLRILDGSRPRGLYLAMLTGGVLVGLPVVAYGLYAVEARGWDPVYALLVGSQFNYWGSLPVAGAWVALVMLACRSLWLHCLTAPLAAVGRMALSNYLLQSVLCTWIFYGHGLGLFGKVERVGQMGVVAMVWALQLAVSPLWLWYLRFGPAEWLWRSLTYGRVQPLRNSSPRARAELGHEGCAGGPGPRLT
jgi:uncharacterized protein